jgi:hypothetical protein
LNIVIFDSLNASLASTLDGLFGLFGPQRSWSSLMVIYVSDEIPRAIVTSPFIRYPEDFHFVYVREDTDIERRIGILRVPRDRAIFVYDGNLFKVSDLSPFTEDSTQNLEGGRDRELSLSVI